jgi:hypothetical protein
VTAARYDTHQLRTLAGALNNIAERAREQTYRLEVLADELRSDIAAERAFSFVLPSHIYLVHHVLSGLDERIGELILLTREVEDLAEDVSAACLNAEMAETQAHSAMVHTHAHAGSVLHSTFFIAVLRMLASNVDLVSSTLTSGPLGAIWQLTHGKPGPDYSAAVIASATQEFHQGSRNLSVTRVRTHSVSAPQSLAEMAMRVPPSEPGAAQVVVERYTGQLAPTWIIYYGGTIDMSLPSSHEPWDLRSNLEAMANVQSDSMRSAAIVAERAGIRPGDHVIHVGYSQGGLIAAQIATQAPPNSASLVTFGAPVGHLDLSALRGVITVEHSEDLVPALSGHVPMNSDDRHTILTTARLNNSEQDALPAHQLARYRQTTEHAERQALARLTQEKEQIFFGLSGKGEASRWRSDREPLR